MEHAWRPRSCAWRADGPHGGREVGEGRTARQPGQVRKEAALTRQGGSLSNLPPSPWHEAADGGAPSFADAETPSIRAGLSETGDERLPVSRRDRRSRARAVDALPGARAQIPPAALRGPDRPGADGADAGQFLRRQPHPSGLHLHRRPRHRQDHDRAHPRPRLQLCRARQDRPAERRHARTRPPLPGDHGLAPRRRDRDGRGLPHRHRRRARDHRERPLPAGLRPHQGLHHRRGAHAVEAGLQRPAEDARGAARARQVPVRHHRDRQGADHGQVALHPLRPEADRVGPDGPASRQDRRRRRRRRSSRTRLR